MGMEGEGREKGDRREEKGKMRGGKKEGGKEDERHGN
jgi:hypothetical protein